MQTSTTRRTLFIVVCALCLSLAALFLTSGLAGWRLGAPLHRDDHLRQQHDASPGHASSKGASDKPSSSSPPSSAPPALAYPECAAFPDTSNVLVVMKTGASEAWARVPTQLMTLLRCLPEFFIYSDMAQTISGYPIYDSLDTVLNKTKDGNKDFDLYRHQQACAIDQDTCNAAAGDVARGGWNLDKFKNVHMAEKVYAARPNYDWYIFIDADTYVLFPTLTKWLAHLDPAKPRYIGSKSFVGNFPFAHGGSGYLVSQAAMRAVADSPGLANSLEEETKRTCCGDFMFAKAVHNVTGVKVTNVLPVINGEKPATLVIDKDTWCKPLSTMHHLSPEEISMFWAWETARFEKDEVTRHRDVFHAFVKPALVPMREDWNNLASDALYLVEGYTDRKFSDGELRKAKHGDKPLSDPEAHAHESFESCGKACAAEPKCLQYRWNDGLCQLGWSIRLGRPMKREEVDAKRWSSGWNIKRIEEFVTKQGECGEIEWPGIEA